MEIAYTLNSREIVWDKEGVTGKATQEPTSYAVKVALQADMWKPRVFNAMFKAVTYARNGRNPIAECYGNSTQKAAEIDFMSYKVK